MKTTGNTILITGGGTGIGRGLAEAFHKLGNAVIIAGRTQKSLDAVTTANPGLKSVPLDIGDAAAIREFAATMARDFPTLNVVINNAGIMRPENLKDPSALADAEATIATNLLGPIRLTAALLPQLQRQTSSAIFTVSSGLAYVPSSATPTYCATKAAIHSYTLSLRRQLAGTTTEVIELVPPYVQTTLVGQKQAEDPNAMPLDEFIAEVMGLLAVEPTPAEIVVERCKPLRNADSSGRFDATYEKVNEMTDARYKTW